LQLALGTWHLAITGECRRQGLICTEEFMPKMKTHKGAAKRFKKTASGKVKRGHSHLRHILTSKAHKRKRKLGKSVLVSDADTPKIKRMIPY
jgi:large subunit ribosomal protein L35